MSDEKSFYTQAVRKRLGNEIKEVGGEDIFKNRRMIKRDSPINGGVSVSAGEAIVVDDSKEDGKVLKDAYTELLQNVKKEKEKNPILFERKILYKVYELVKKKLPLNEKEADRVAANAPHQKYSLTYFIATGGVCRHQGLFSAYLLERLVDDGILDGQFSYDRSMDIHKGEKSGHAWARYTSGIDGSIYIIDVAQRYIGPLDIDYEVKDRWDYHRDTDDKRTEMMVFSEDPFAHLSEGLGSKFLKAVGWKKENIVMPRLVEKPKKKKFYDHEDKPEPVPFLRLEDVWREGDPEGIDPNNPFTHGNRWRNEGEERRYDVQTFRNIGDQLKEWKEKDSEGDDPNNPFTAGKGWKP